MHFYFGFPNVSVLFEGWDINSIGGKLLTVLSSQELSKCSFSSACVNVVFLSPALIGSFIAIFVMAMLYEGLKIFREVIHQKKAKIYGKRINVIHYEKVSPNDDIAPPPSYGTIERLPQ